MIPLSAIGQSSAFLKLLDDVSKLAKLHRPVLILGERGTGKELVAHRLHYLSPRWEQPLVSLNCGALTDELLSSELFGHEKGSFTGANERKAGRIESAEGGSLFLDELGNSNSRFQEHLLRVLEQGQYERVGGSQTLQADIRVIAATNLEPETLYDDKVVRRDLLDRLSFAVIRTPPLRERKDDIPYLLEHFTTHFMTEVQWSYQPIFKDLAIQELMDHDWPGNIRELKNTIERSLFEADGEDVETIIWSPFQKSKLTPLFLVLEKELKFPVDLKQYLADQEIELMKKAFSFSHEQHQHAAKCLKLTYHQWRALLKKHHLNSKNLNK